MNPDGTRRARPSPAMAVALAALFVALGGSAWAVATVGPRDIENDAVRARHIAAGSVRSGQVANETLNSVDLNDGQVLGRDIRDATVRGSDVADGSLAGADLAPGVIGMQQVREFDADSALDSSPLKTAQASCPPGEVATGGGASVATGIDHVALIANRPVLSNKENPPVGWEASAVEVTDTVGAWKLEVFVVCGRPSVKP